jgi:hypothetical protein
MVLVSIIIGMSVTELLAGLADTITRKNSRTFSWIHVLLSLGLLIACIQIWWEMWDFSNITEWSFLNLLLILFPPVFLYLIARIINPGREFSGSLDDYYFLTARRIWVLIGLAVIIGNTFRSLINEESKLFVVDNLSAIPILCICLIMAISKNRLIHQLFMILIILIILLDVLLINFLISNLR